jgi:hypothetical protein
LTKDVGAYYEIVKGWKVGVLNESFEALREIANLFVVRYVLRWGLCRGREERRRCDYELE